jgi:hypothetical protein
MPLGWRSLTSLALHTIHHLFAMDAIIHYSFVPLPVQISAVSMLFVASALQRVNRHTLHTRSASALRVRRGSTPATVSAGAGSTRGRQTRSVSGVLNRSSATPASAAPSAPSRAPTFSSPSAPALSRSRRATGARGSTRAGAGTAPRARRVAQDRCGEEQPLHAAGRASSRSVRTGSGLCR